MSPWDVFATPPSILSKEQFICSSAPASTASCARYWSKRSLSVVYPSKSRSVTLSLGSTSFIPLMSRQRRPSGTAKSAS